MSRVYKEQIDNIAEFIQAMHKLATVMDKDVDIVMKRFITFLKRTPLSWKKTFSFVYRRAAHGIRDSWFYDPNEFEEV